MAAMAEGKPRLAAALVSGRLLEAMLEEGVRLEAAGGREEEVRRV